MKCLNLIKGNLFTIAIVSIIALVSCKDDHVVELSDTTLIYTATTDTILYVTVKGDNVPVYLSFPPNCEKNNLPAVVLLHGSGGMWKDDNREAGIMSSQNRDWKTIFDANCMIGAYIDSYTPRGCVEREGDWKVAPLAFSISAQFVRPYDAYAGLELLRNLVNTSGQPIVRPNDVGILGFSDGATALTATLYDTDVTPTDWEWTQEFDKEYTEANGVGLPAERPESGGFSCGVFYYGGSVGHSYWGGNPCSNSDFMYINYAPILYQVPELGYLTENTLCAIEEISTRGGNVTKYVYESAEHGFDGNDLDQKPQSDLARTHTIDWFKDHLNM